MVRTELIKAQVTITLGLAPKINQIHKTLDEALIHEYTLFEITYPFI